MSLYCVRARQVAPAWGAFELLLLFRVSMPFYRTFCTFSLIHQTSRRTLIHNYLYYSFLRRMSSCNWMVHLFHTISCALFEVSTGESEIICALIEFEKVKLNVQRARSRRYRDRWCCSSGRLGWKAGRELDWTNWKI